MNSKQIILVSWFSEIGINDRPTVGGKGASLGELTRAGIRVPNGFVVTTASFEKYLAGLDEQGNIRSSIQSLDADDLAGITKTCEQARQLIKQSSLPGELLELISNSYKELCEDRENVPVAIRSSATSEDSEEASFAGLQDTYLWVRGIDELIESVRNCWASLYSTESVSYRLRLNLPEENLAMGVVVQEMVDSLCSGVMFTRSPTTGDKSVVTLEASWGLGSSIVSGEVTPDKFVVNKVTGEIMDRSIATKTVQHTPSIKGGVIEEEVPEEKQGIPCLFDEQVKELVQVAKEIERHYGSPQDIEWAISKDDRAAEGPFLLQSRPETVWAGKEVKPVAKPKANAFDHVFSVLGGRK